MNNGAHSGRSVFVPVAIQFFSAIALQMSGIFLPIFAQDIGSSKMMIGVIQGVYGIAYLSSSLFSGRLSDMKGRVLFIRIGLGCAAVAYLLQLFATTPVLLAGIRATLGFFIAMTDGALMAYNFEVGGRTSRFTSLGALGWLVGGVFSIFNQNYHLLFIISAVSCTASFAMTFYLHEPAERRPIRPNIPEMAKRNYRVYLPFLLRNIGANMVWFIMPLYLVNNLGATKAWVAIIQCVNTGVQFVFMMFIDKLSARKLYLTGILSSGVVFAGYALARSPAQIIPFQVMLALSWSCLYLGALLTLFKNNPERATCAAMLFSTGSLSQSIGPFVGGFIVQAWGYFPLMYGAAGLCVVGSGVALTPEKNRKQLDSASKPAGS
jgi:MFS family permease